MENRLEDCEGFLKVIDLVLDGEASQDQKQFLRDHIESCSDCFEFFNIEQEFKDIIKSKIENIQVPDGLLEAIKIKIKALA